MKRTCIVVGGGPAGSTLAWDLARRASSVTVLERTRFPREKVCGDYVEPRGLRILERDGTPRAARGRAGRSRSRTRPPTSTGSAATAGEIPFYGLGGDLPPHGYIVARDELDDAMLTTAAEAGATVHEETSVTSVDAGPDGVDGRGEAGREDRPLPGEARRRRRRRQLGRRAATAAWPVDDPRYVAVAQRAYATVDGDVGEAAFFFDRGPLPRLRLGVPARRRAGQPRRRHPLRDAAAARPARARALRRLRRGPAATCIPRCATLELCAPPIGGIVRTYGAAGPNHFDGGVLVGDAGCFVDPMTGEGITPAMESALLASPVLRDALDVGPLRRGAARAVRDRVPRATSTRR